MYVLDTIFRDFRTLISSIVIKYDTLAKANETVEITRNADNYLSAVNEEDTFATYRTFDPEVIVSAGVAPNLDAAVPYVEDKKRIPVTARDRVVSEQRKFIINNYVEENNYYRMLSGLPNTEDFGFIFLTMEEAVEVGVAPNTPIHEYDDDAILKIEKSGILARIRIDNPSKKYLGYVGSNRINIARARMAKNFAVLRMTHDISDTFYEEFNNIYDLCREYFMTVIYNRTFSKNYDLYDNFIAMMIMVFTLQRIIANVFKYGIDQDFYDLGSIQLMFKSYNVPFIENLPLDYQRILVRNLNNLLRYKSTDKVLYDICSLLGFERIQIFKYFLLKKHNLDNEGNPLFLYKEVENGDGTTSIVEDHERMYGLIFQSVELNERNQALALSNNINTLDYNQVVIDDPYWWSEDDELKQFIYESDFNFSETKFVSMNIMYKMTQMLFEVTYVFRMLLDKKSDTVNITVELPKLFEDKKINLFELTVFLCALLAKKNGMAGNIIGTPSKILDIMGFNFSADFDMIRKYIRDNPSKIDNTVLQYLSNPRVFTAADVNDLYSDIKAFNDFIVERMGLSQDIEEYRAYRKLFQALMVTENTDVLFTKNDGTLAKTYLEYLEDHDVRMANFVTEAIPEEIGNHIDHILAKLNDAMVDLKYLSIVNDSNSVTLNAVITLVKFFKSYTTDITSFNILYLMDSRYFNMVKLIDRIESISVNMNFVDTSLLMNYKTELSYSTETTQKDVLAFLNSADFLTLIQVKDVHTFRHQVRSMTSESTLKVLLKLKDNSSWVTRMILSSSLNMRDQEAIHGQLYPKEQLHQTHDINSMTTTQSFTDKLDLNYADNISSVKTQTIEKDELKMRHTIRIIREI